MSNLLISPQKKIKNHDFPIKKEEILPITIQK